MKAYEIG